MTNSSLCYTFVDKMSSQLIHFSSKISKKLNILRRDLVNKQKGFKQKIIQQGDNKINNSEQFIIYFRA